MKANKSFIPIVTELFLRGRKFSLSLAFISQSYFKKAKTIRLNATHYFIMKIPNKGERQQIMLNHLSYIEFKDFVKLYKDYIKKALLFLVDDTSLPSNNPLRFRKKLL